ncbi:HWE histidine kinase domain-containing protein [Afifella pfennigii]|uniref:HWE histidine kinase domain-containing protein n=1 Tax=Afifella pfennigii TaxID=209897 RepID=UPI00047B2664|nr:HWE histidine kinase domain-containing protein [Afifella pfennigii]
MSEIDSPSPDKSALAALMKENRALRARLAELEAGQEAPAGKGAAAASLLRREEQQRVVAELGNTALAGTALSQLFATAARQTAQALGCDYCKVLQLQPDGEGLVLVAGEGWNERLIGRAYVESGESSQAGFTLMSGSAVVIHDLATETRFRASPLFAEHDVKSGVSVLIGEPERPWGVLGVHACQSDRFSEDDIGFVQAVANILAVAIERQGSERRLEEQEERYRLSLRAVTGLVYEQDMESGEVHTNEGFAGLVGMPEPAGTDRVEWWTSLIHPDDLPGLLAIRQELKHGLRESFGVTYRVRHAQGRWIDIWDRAYLTFGPDGEPQRLFGFASDISEVVSVQRRQAQLLAELDHRVKNMLANLSAIAAQSRSGTHTIQSYIRTLRGRIDTMAQIHDLLSRSGWAGAGLRALVARIVEPYASQDPGKLHIEGPETMLEPRLAQSIGLVLHELASNAARHGALASEQGRLHISWQPPSNGEALRFLWRESGAKPAERQPDGFGMFVIRSMLKAELKGEPELEFLADGFSCSFPLTLAEPQMARPQETQRETALAEAPPGPVDAAPGVLIVEDSPLLSSIMQEAVEAAGWPVVGIAGEVAEARRMVAEENFGVALLDLNLGDEIAGDVARDLKERGIPYLIASAHAPSDVLEPDLADAPFLPKPIDQRALVELLRLIAPPN